MPSGPKPAMVKRKEETYDIHLFPGAYQGMFISVFQIREVLGSKTRWQPLHDLTMTKTTIS